VSDRGESRPDDPAGTRPKVDPDALRAPQPPRDLPWAEPEDRAESRLEASIARFDEVHVEQEHGTSEHVGRFQFLLGGLIAVGVIAVAAIVIVLVAGRTDQPDTSWSAWRPTGDDPLQQIASHVGATYRLENGDQIAAVTGGPLQIDTGDGSKTSAHVVRQDPRTQNLDLEDGKTALFNLCGTARECTFAGTPSGERLLFVRREALELALYALHYTDVDQVVVTFPTLVQARTAGATPEPVPSAVFIRRDQVQAMLDRPLGDTLSSPTPSIGAVARSTAAGLLQQLPGYAYKLEPASDLSVLFILSDLSSAVSSAAPATTTTPQTGAPAPTTPSQKGKPGKKGG
jgi:hypothetical protein